MIKIPFIIYSLIIVIEFSSMILAFSFIHYNIMQITGIKRFPKFVDYASIAFICIVVIYEMFTAKNEFVVGGV